NIVLNAGDSKPFTPSASLGSIATDTKAESLKVTVTADGLVVIVSPIRSAEIYDTAGRRGSLTNAQRPGIYIVRATLPDGTPASAKVIVR
ncbi:MAG: hypothetical protein K2M97_02620, partial [Muribaculaceae bacterium]|nr:hypothetical protein [Muribaculaceae bacterium]